jgi:hypothetical protein
LTHDLGIQFLWMDALCIVQDDYAGWELEASRMKDVYSGSLITIATPDAAGGPGGCFFPNSECHDKAGAFVATGGDSGVIIRVQPRDIRTFAEDSVFNTRGWVLQETVLSNRVVHFMRSELYWECRCECRTETVLVRSIDGAICLRF